MQGVPLHFGCPANTNPPIPKKRRRNEVHGVGNDDTAMTIIRVAQTAQACRQSRKLSYPKEEHKLDNAGFMSSRRFNPHNRPVHTHLRVRTATVIVWFHSRQASYSQCDASHRGLRTRDGFEKGLHHVKRKAGFLPLLKKNNCETPRIVFATERYYLSWTQRSTDNFESQNLRCEVLCKEISKILVRSCFLL